MFKYDEDHRKIYCTTTNGNTKTPVGSWWIGQPKTHYKLSIHQYAIMTKLIEGYNQRLPTIILSSEHRGYNNEEIVQLVDTFAQFVFRRVVYYQVSEEKFAENLQQLAVFVNCGFIIVVMGAEYLKGAQQYELTQLSKNIRSKDADYIGLLTPYID